METSVVRTREREGTRRNRVYRTGENVRVTPEKRDGGSSWALAASGAEGGVVGGIGRKIRRR
jgi:hypothetical protein